MFWGRAPDSQARMNLRQTLTCLRRALAAADGVHLVTRGDQVTLDLNGLWVDVARFEELVAEATLESLEAAMALYTGDLLDGFSLKEEAFEEWVAAERARLRLRAIEALERLIAEHRTAQDLSQALATAHHLLLLDPLREDIHREVMRLHAVQGRLSAAMKQYEICREVLRRELQAEPEAETQKLIQEIRRRRAIAVQSPAAASVLLPEGPSVVVLPFESQGDDPGQGYFAEGVSEGIIAGLTRFRELVVIGFTSSKIARDHSLCVAEIGKAFGVTHIVDGSIRNNGDRLRIAVQLTEAATGHRLWAEQYDREPGNLFAVQDEIADLIVATLAGRIETASRLRSVRKPIKDLVAHDWFLRAKEKLRKGGKEDVIDARSNLERAISLDPDYALAHATLALSYIHEYESSWSSDPHSTIRSAFVLGQRAVALDAAESVAHRALAYAAHYLDELQIALREIDRAIALNPNDYSNLCVKAWILNFSGRPEEALTYRDLSLRINPIAPDNCLLDSGMALYTLQRYEQSAAAFGQMLSWDLLRHSCLAACCARLGRDDEARRATSRALEAIHMTCNA